LGCNGPTLCADARLKRRHDDRGGAKNQFRHGVKFIALPSRV
jgi:hypothetical protein